MRKLLLSLLFIFSMTMAKSFSQTNVYHPFPDSNAVWCEEWFGVDGSCDYYEHYARFMKGDSIVGEKIYDVLYCSGWGSSFLCQQHWSFQNERPLLIRQDIASKKVYTMYMGIDTLLYDFNLSLGNIVPPSAICHANRNWVSRIDSVLMGEKYRRRLWLSTIDDQNLRYVALIEGVGSTFGMTSFLEPQFEGESRLTGFSDTINYNHATSFCGVNVNITETSVLMKPKVFPNPAKEELTVFTNDHLPMEIKIYDIAGRCVLKSSLTNTVTLQIGHLSKGIFVYELRNKDGLIDVGKLVKE